MPATNELGWRHEIVWNNNLDFEIWYKPSKNSVRQHYPKPSVWFKVRDLLRKRFLDAEKLKW